jgi:hypothetical protein
MLGLSGVLLLAQLPAFLLQLFSFLIRGCFADRLARLIRQTIQFESVLQLSFTLAFEFDELFHITANPSILAVSDNGLDILQYELPVEHDVSILLISMMLVEIDLPIGDGSGDIQPTCGSAFCNCKDSILRQAVHVE